MLQNKKGLSFIFAIVFIASIVIVWRFGDWKLAVLVFFGYAAFKILTNFLRKEKVYEEYY